MYYCCSMMSVHIKEKTIYYIPKFREFGIPVIDGGSSFIEICFCPWCGQKLPSSLRNKWFDILEAKGIELDDNENNIPEEMKSDDWWQKDIDESKP